MIHKIENGFVISSHQVWLPGFFQDERTAKYAFRFNDEDLQKLMDEVKPNPITFKMLQKFRKSKTDEVT